MVLFDMSNSLFPFRYLFFAILGMATSALAIIFIFAFIQSIKTKNIVFSFIPCIIVLLIFPILLFPASYGGFYDHYYAKSCYENNKYQVVEGKISNLEEIFDKNYMFTPPINFEFEINGVKFEVYEGKFQGTCYLSQEQYDQVKNGKKAKIGYVECKNNNGLNETNKEIVYFELLE